MQLLIKCRHTTQTLNLDHAKALGRRPTTSWQLNEVDEVDKVDEVDEVVNNIICPPLSTSSTLENGHDSQGSEQLHKYSLTFECRATQSFPLANFNKTIYDSPLVKYNILIFYQTTEVFL